jgi:hypothetical protein
MPASTLDPSPYLKLSGIAITLASVLEADNRHKEAWEVYLQAVSLPNPSTPPSPTQNDAPISTKSPQPEERRLTPQETLRQVAIAHKLGEMAATFGFGGNDEEEKWLSWAVEKLLSLLKEESVGFRGVSSGEKTNGKDSEKTGEEAGLLLADLDLPEWVTTMDLGAPLEALGAFYARQGNLESVFFHWSRFPRDSTAPCLLDTPCHFIYRPSPFLCKVRLGNLRLWRIDAEVRLLSLPLPNSRNGLPPRCSNNEQHFFSHNV